jgi:hypothetical protein
MTTQTINKSFIIYKDSLSVLNKLTDEQAGKLFKAIFNYQTNNVLPEDTLISIIFEPFLNQFKRDDIKYQNVVERNKINGSKGGRPKTQENPLGYLETQENPRKPKKADSDSDSDSDSENDSKNDIILNNNNIYTHTDNQNRSKTEAKCKQNVIKTELDSFCDDIAKSLKDIIEKKLSRKVSSNDWPKQIKLTIKDLAVRGEEKARQDIIKCIQAIEDHFGKDYFPVIQSASSLREKFAKIENYLAKTPENKKNKLDDEFLAMTRNNQGGFYNA